MIDQTPIRVKNLGSAYQSYLLMVSSGAIPTERRSAKRFSVNDSEAQVGQFFVKLLWAHALCSIGLAFWYHTFAEAFLIGIPAALVPQLLIKSKPNNLLSKASVGISLMIYSALFIHEARGMTEAHFHVFVALAFLLAYRDWRVVLAATLTIAVHHVAFAWLMFAGAPVFIFSTKASLILLTVIHAAFVVFESSVVAAIAIQGRKEWEHAEDVDRVGVMLRGLSKDRLDRHPHQPGENVLTYALHQMVHRIEDNLVLGDQVRASGEEIATTTVVFQNKLSEVQNQISRLATSAKENQSLVREQSDSMDQVGDALQDLFARLSAVSESSIDQRNEVAIAVNALSNVTGAISAMAKTVDSAESVAQTSEVTAHSMFSDLNERLQSTSETVSSLNGLAGEIHGFIAVIEEIAEQTNLLALNAAIEAARAGESGRGFAVVADEVRKLAERSATSSREVSQIVQRMMGQIQASTEAITGSKTRAGLKPKTEEAMQLFGSTLAEVRSELQGVRQGNVQVQSTVDALESVVSKINSVAETNYTTASGLDQVAARASASLEASAKVGEIFSQTYIEIVDGSERSSEELSQLEFLGQGTQRTAQQVQVAIAQQYEDLNGLKQGFITAISTESVESQPNAEARAPLAKAA